MKIYVFDMAWQGALICVAENKEEATEKMLKSGEIDEDTLLRNRGGCKIEEHDLNEVVFTVGDI